MTVVTSGTHFVKFSEVLGKWKNGTRMFNTTTTTIVTPSTHFFVKFSEILKILENSTKCLALLLLL